MTNTNVTALPSPGRPRAPRSGWAQPAILGRPLPLYIAGRVVRLLLLIALPFTDVTFVKTVVDLVLGQTETVSWIVSILITIGAVVMAVTAGILSRTAEAEGGSQLRAHLVLLGWLVLGIALTAMRFNAAAWTSVAPHVLGAASVGDPVGKDEGMATLLALLYLAAGILGYVEGRSLAQPHALPYLLGRRLLDRLELRLVGAQATTVRAEDDLRRAQAALAGLTAERAAATDARTALADQLMAHSRVLIATALGRPEASGLTEVPPVDRRPGRGAAATEADA